MSDQASLLTDDVVIELASRAFNDFRDVPVTADLFAAVATAIHEDTGCACKCDEAINPASRVRRGFVAAEVALPSGQVAIINLSVKGANILPLPSRRALFLPGLRGAQDLQRQAARLIELYQQELRALDEEEAALLAAKAVARATAVA